MRKLVILGAGTAGTMMLNKLHKRLNLTDWEITIVDRDKNHYYQPGFLFVPFGIYDKQEVVKNKEDFFPDNVNVIWEEIDRIEGEDKKVLLQSGRSLDYEILVIATGTTPRPEETEGMDGPLWYKDIFDFYTYDGACSLADKLATWKGGDMVINIADMPIKCPVAPLEFAFLADAYFTDKGMRDKVNIKYVTPLSGAFTKPKASKFLGGLMKEKNIEVIPDFYIMHVDNKEKEIVSYDEIKVKFDLLVTIPTNKGDDMVDRSNMGDEEDLNYVPTDKHTLVSKGFNNVFVIGDATNVPASKAGSVAHFEADVLIENILSFIEGKPMEEKFDGHANCFIETGHGKACLIDFNYETEPLPGKYPLPELGLWDFYQ